MIDENENEFSDNTKYQNATESFDSNYINETKSFSSGLTNIDIQVQVSNFVPSRKNIKYHELSVVAGMRLGESLVFQGQYSLTVQKGSVSIYGAILHVGTNKYTVSASATTALPRITAVPTKKKHMKKHIRTAENLDFVEPQGESQFDSIILLESINNGLEKIPKYIPELKHVWGQSFISNQSSITSSRTFHPIYTGASSIKTVTSYASWNSIASDIVSDFKSFPIPPVVFVTGPKNSGKSTFCRFLMNHCGSLLGLGSVSFLDCDPGQPEYAPPGVMYLCQPLNYNFSSPFSHPIFEGVVKAHSLGCISPKDMPLFYSACFEDLFSCYKSSQLNSSSLLIINTPGWTKGLGLDLLVEMMKYAEFSHSVFLGADDVETYQDFCSRVSSLIDTKSQVQKFYEPDSFLQVSPEKTSVQHNQRYFSAADIRKLQLLSYLSYNHDTDKFDIDQNFVKLPYFNVPYIIPVHNQKKLTSQEASNMDNDGPHLTLRSSISTHSLEIAEILNTENIFPTAFCAPNNVLFGCSYLKYNDCKKGILKNTYEKLLYHTDKSKFVRESAKIAAFGIIAAEGIHKSDIQICLENVIVSVIAVEEQSFVQISDSIYPVLISSFGPNINHKNNITSSSHYIPCIPSHKIQVALSPSNSRCLGIAVLSGIDTSLGTAQLQTSLNPTLIDELETTCEKIILVRGRISMPLQLLELNQFTHKTPQYISM